ncbi:(2Fe-2S)-binding protein [Streptomyces sp. NPDC003077]|uniref:(2Fe-2S)-binding protein n=1 Tax=Streptomyces sp. NPDC003077 TaxID=3154443 RepID=UPI0033B61580
MRVTDRDSVPRAPAGSDASGSVAPALAEVAALGPFFAVELGDVEEGWHPVGTSYARGLDDLIAARVARYGTREPRVAASIVQLGHAARLWSPVLACAVLHGVVPDLAGLRRADHGPALRLPVAPAGWRADDLPRLADTLYEVVMVRHLEPLAAGLRVKVARRLLDGNAASALAEAARAILAARPDVREPLTDLVGTLLRTGRLAGTGHVTGPDLSFRRRSCCLYYRVPLGVKCGDCGLAG